MSVQRAPDEVWGLSSMATKTLLAELADALRARAVPVRFDSAGGVAVARDVRAGTDVDLVVLDAATMTQLDDDGLLRAGTLTPLFVSEVVAAVPDDAADIPLASEDDLRAALTGAGRIAYSTGPSGKAFVALLDRWDLHETLADRLVQAEPGVPVGRLLVAGDADLGFQQRSELSGLDGVRVLGALPGAAATQSTFSGAVPAASSNAGRAREVLDFVASDEAAPYVRAAGMTPA